MIDILHREFIYLWYYTSIQLEQILKYLAIGIVIGSFVSVFLKSRIHGLMARLKDNKIGILGIIPAAALGIVSPLCLYGTVPIVASFSKSGMREDWIAAFMMSSVLLNPQLFFFSFALGTKMAIFRLVISFLGGCVAGILIRVFYHKKSFYQFNEFNEPHNRDTDPNLLIRLLKNMYRNVKITLPYFLLGILLTALYQRYVPNAIIIDLFGSNRGFGALMAAAIGIPLYTCGGGTIPLIAAWLDAGMSQGSAISFMVAGPATKITNLGALKIVLGMKNFMIYLAYVVIFATISGVIIDLLF